MNSFAGMVTGLMFMQIDNNVGENRQATIYSTEAIPNRQHNKNRLGRGGHDDVSTTQTPNTDGNIDMNDVVQARSTYSAYPEYIHWIGMKSFLK